MIPAEPHSLPSISSNGVTEPSRTSLMRFIFSSSTLFRSCGALVITIMKSRNMKMMGMSRLRI